MSRSVVDRAALGQLLDAVARHPTPDTLAALTALIHAGTAPAPDPTPWLTLAEAARLLRCSERSIRRAIDRGDLPHQRIGRRVLVASTAVVPHRRDTTGRDRTGPAPAGGPGPDLGDTPPDPKGPR